MVEAGGDYLFTVKANQRTLAEDIRWLFLEPALLDDRRATETVNKGHGRLETRHLVTSSDLATYSRWPYLAQVFKLTLSWRGRDGKRHRETRYGLTSLPASVDTAARLLAPKRGHWTIENRVHWVKDVTMGEDASLIHCDHGPANMAVLRDMALNLVRLGGQPSVAATLRTFSRNPSAALALVGVTLNENA